MALGDIVSLVADTADRSDGPSFTGLPLSRRQYVVDRIPDELGNGNPTAQGLGPETRHLGVGE